MGYEFWNRRDQKPKVVYFYAFSEIVSRIHGGDYLEKVLTYSSGDLDTKYLNH